MKVYTLSLKQVLSTRIFQLLQWKKELKQCSVAFRRTVAGEESDQCNRVVTLMSLQTRYFSYVVQGIRCTDQPQSNTVMEEVNERR